MLSWVSGINRYQNHRQQAWYENEIRLNVRTDEGDLFDETPTRRGGGLFPKLRRAFEVATHTSNGSFPIQEPMVPPSPGEVTAFEALESPCNQSMMSESCATLASYDMSRIDHNNIISESLSFSVAPSPTASEADSLFGGNIRDMVQLDQKERDKDNVWLLSCGDEIDCPPLPAVKSTATNVLKRVSVLRLPMRPDRRAKRNQEPTILDDQEDFDEGLGDEAEEDEEEEIDFGDSAFLISQAKDHFSMDDGIFQQDSCGDENENSNIMLRFGRGRNRTSILRKNFKGMWSGTDCGKRSKNPKRRYRQSKKKTTPGITGPFAVDPLKELSKCHEKMMENEQPFSPKRAFSRIRNRIRRDVSDSSIQGQHSILLSASSSASSGEVHAEDDDTSEVTLPSALFPSISVTTTNTLDACPSDREETTDRSEESESHSSGSDSQSSGTEEQSCAETTPSQEQSSSKKKGSKPPTAFKIKFRSPRNDTPRIVLDELSDESDSGEEPRALYTDEGFVEGYIHPKGMISGSASMDSRSSLNHVFHSELSTLYEVSSSLESSSFSTKSSAASTEASSMCATVGNLDKVVGYSSDPAGVNPASDCTTVTTSDNSSNQESLARSTCSTSKTQTSSKHSHSHHDPRSFIRSNIGGHSQHGGIVDDHEAKLRWELSLGLMDDSRHWRQPNMSIMNTEELSQNYVAEI